MAATKRSQHGPPECHPDRPYQAKGLCAQCYMKQYDANRDRAERRKNPGDYAPNYRRPPSKPKRNADCHPDRPHVALGLCRACYQKDRPGRPRAECHPDRPLVALGLCGACLSRNQYWNDPEKRREQLRAANKRMRDRTRAEMVEAYGSQCACPKCPEANPAFLTLEHINGDGAQHRRVTRHVYEDLRRQGWPKEGYTLLCWNCNAMTRGGRTCPHMEGA